jgi:hypothetical protein
VPPFFGGAIAIASAVIAGKANEQAKQAAPLERPRTKAIEHVRQALAAITNNGFVTSEELGNLAKEISELAFGSEVQDALTQAASKALGLNRKILPERKEQVFQKTLDELVKELDSLLQQMNQEAKLGR